MGKRRTRPAFALALLGFAAVAASAGPPTMRPAGTTLSVDTTFTSAKSLSGTLARTDPALLGRTDSTPVNVMVKYDFDATASYTGNVGGLAATSPAVTGKKLKDNGNAVRAYEQHAVTLSNTITNGIKAAVPDAKIRNSFTTVYGGIAAQVPANKVADLLNVAGVAAVQQDTLEQPNTSVTPAFTGASNVWPSLGGQTHAAENIVVGVIDTGIWPEHPSFANNGLPVPPGGPYGCQFGDGSDTAHLGPTFACNRKLVGAYAKMTTYMAAVGAGAEEFCNNTTKICSARDPEGHGTHTASTAAGDGVGSAVLYGVERGPISGMAPGARVIMYRVCAAQGCFSSDSVSAVHQAITDGVNVINFSISGGGNPYADPVELAFLDATNAGISVNASAGNAGPGAGTSDHAGPWVTTVGASTGPRAFTSTLHLTADGGASLDVPGVTITTGISTATPVVMAATLPKAGGGNEDALCQSDLAAGAATGKVVVCSRGTNGRIDKGRRVLAGGAAGMILHNQSAGVTDLESDNHYLPAIQTQFNGNSIATFVTTHANVKATWSQGIASPAQADVMASFSSRGPRGDWIKPDVTAPGVQVLAGTTPQPDQTTADNGPPGNLYMAIAGTSMSSPHSAGISALVKAAHPSWTPPMIKSALMLTAAQDVVKEDGVTPFDPFDAGAGSIRANRAVNPPFVLNETYANFVAAGTDPLHRIDLNIASVNAPTMSGLITTKRTAINVSGVALNLAVSTEAPDGVKIYVSDKPPGPSGPTSSSSIPLKTNGTTDIWITISAPEVEEGQYFGRVTFDPKKPGISTGTMPVAFFKQQGVVSLTQSCDPSSFKVKTGVAHCQTTVANFASVPADVDLMVTNADKGKLVYSNISPPATPINTDQGLVWSGTLTPALAPKIDSIVDITGNGPAGGYLPLSLFGGNATIPGADDAITTVNVPTFYYGGEPYSQVGVVTNGYIVIGGGGPADVNFFPQTFPNAARPNNVIAPFWTDLNTSTPGGGGQILVNVLTDGSTNWLIIDFEAVKNFSNSTTHTGEIWLRLEGGAAGTGAASEQITISYDVANAGAGDPGSAINSGAENRDGTSGKNITPAPANGTEWRVNTLPPTAGGSQTVTYNVSSKNTGTYQSVATMTSDRTPGVTEVVQTLTVVP